MDDCSNLPLIFGDFCSFVASPETVTESCERETFTARCPYSQQIIITKALYGHMALGKCLTVDFGHLGCAADITDIVSQRCDGKQKCEIDIDDDEIVNEEPCLNGLELYMEITHACIPGKIKSL